jgi:hypothetical protein
LSPAKYIATSQMVLLPPLSQANANYNGVANPYMGLDGLQSMAQVVANAMMDDETGDALKKAGVSQYSVEYNSLTAGPILVLQVTEPSPAQTSNAITALDQQVPVAVARLQKEASISSRNFILAKVISRPSTPSKSTKTQLRLEVLALVAGLVLTLLAVSVIDGWRDRRRRGSPDGDSHNRSGSVPAFTETTGRPFREPQDASGHSPTAVPPAPLNHSGYHARPGE